MSGVRLAIMFSREKINERVIQEIPVTKHAVALHVLLITSGTSVVVGSRQTLSICHWQWDIEIS